MKSAKIRAAIPSNKTSIWCGLKVKKRFTVTVGSSTMRITHPKMSVKQPLACCLMALFTSVDKCYIWASLSFGAWNVIPKCRDYQQEIKIWV